MKLAARIAHMTGNGKDGWAILGRARDMIAVGEAVTMLTIGEPDVKTDPAVLSAMMAAAVAGNTGYTDIAGQRALRAEIAARVSARTGVATSPAQIVVTPGGQAALFAAHMALLGAGQTGLFVAPHYPTYPGTIRAGGGVALAVPARPEHGFQPEAHALDAAAAASDARTLLINSPNNPTGVIYSRDTMEGIAEVCERRDLWLISDEVYDTQVWEGTHISPRTLPGMAKRTIVIGSLSKSHAMTGSRIGWVVAPEEVAHAVHALAVNTTYGVPGFIQDAGLFALREGQDLETRIAAPFRRRRDVAVRALAGSQAVRLTPPAGAMYVMADIRATGLSGADFAERLLADERIAVMPGESFGASAAGHLRIALTLDDEALKKALLRLRSYAEALVR
ncbi:pyridoxal phosphate-dependent aminotransferase [Phaeovulum sp.]|uniref:pyridoxal phosphate-dependent aminotransferase n=1 Tax=Phaeovulum sp. TaxID=2934796 RepID=UPI0039E669AD